jgi:prophage regulatory protein
MELNDNAVIPFMTWVKEYTGVSEATARRMCVPGGNGPPLVQISTRRLGVRFGDHKAWLAARMRA